MAVHRLPIPAAFVDPAFQACLAEAIGEPELIREFDRLYGATLGTKCTEADMQAYTKFVHDSIYMRLNDEAIWALRADLQQPKTA